MIKEIKKTQEVITHERYCDICGGLMSYRHYKCTYCNKDVCFHCQADTGEETEYTTVYCQSCWDKGGKYRSKIDKAEQFIEKLYQKWEADCKGV